MGAGWAGCAAAVELARRGHRRSRVFEAAPHRSAAARGASMRDGTGARQRPAPAARRLRRRRAARSPWCTVPTLPRSGLLARGPLAIRPLRARRRRTVAACARRGTARAWRSDSLGRTGCASASAWDSSRGSRASRVRDSAARPTPPSPSRCHLPAAAARCAPGSRCALPRSTRRASHASAQVFANVLRAAFAGPAGASDFLVATTDLSSLSPGGTPSACRRRERRRGRAARAPRGSARCPPMR
ncbi:MAG: hypothetical protein MZV65_18880 [Chromatiales bacterium]|nr:hypothetical protein [Chromatiales bacterium]